MASAVVIAATAVIAAGVTLTVVMVVVAALNIGVKGQNTGQEVSNRGIRIAGHAAIELNTCLCQCHPGTATDTAADQNIRLQGGQDTCQRTVTLTVGVYHLGCDHSAVLHFVNLELLGVTEMLEDQTVSISNCNSHISLLLWNVILLL